MRTKARDIKRQVFGIIKAGEEGNKASKAFDSIIMTLIALSVLSIVLESFADISVKYRTVFQTLEIVTIVVFSLEYILRLWTADLLYPEAKHPRLKYVFSGMAIIDLLAILPFYLPFLTADFRYLRMIRLIRMFRVLRVFKLGRYLDALQIIMKVIRASRAKLIMSVVICFSVMLFSAIVMYTVENPEQPEAFPNVIAALWWAICTLTTVGYGDVYPVTVIGKIFASLISLVGIGIIAIPTGIIAAGFTQVIETEPLEKTETSDKETALETMDEEELFQLQIKLSKRLRPYGYTIMITNEEQGKDDCGKSTLT